MIRNIINKFFSGNQRSVTIKKNIGISFLLKGISILTSFILVPITIGYISSELYGVWLTLSSILTWIQFMDLGLTQGLKNKLAEAVAKDEWLKAKQLVSTTYFLMIIIFFPICILGFFLVPYVNWSSLLNIADKYNQAITFAMQIITIFLSLQMVLNVIVSVVAAFQKVAMSQSFVVIGNILSLITIIILTKTVPPSLPLLATVLVGCPIVIIIIGSIILYKSKFKDVSPSISMIKLNLFKDLFSLGVKFFILNIQVVVIYQSTNILISHVSSPEAVTNYNIAYRYLNLAMMAYTIITAPLWPAYTDAFTKGDYAWMIRMRNKMNKILGLCVLGCLFLCLISPLFYKLWLGNKVEVPQLMTWMVGAYVIAYCFMNLNGTLVMGMSKALLSTIGATIGMIIFIPLSLFLGHHLKEYGVVLALIIVNTIYAIQQTLQANKLLNQTATGIWNK